MSDLDNKYDEAEGQQPQPLGVGIFNSSKSETPYNSDAVKETGPQNTNQSLDHTQASVRVASSKAMPVYKWNLEFFGDKRGLSLNVFLERTDELCEARQVTKEELFRSAIDLFKGRALVWYRAIRREVHDWSSLGKQMREELQPHDYDEKLLEETKRCTQGEDESIGVYLAAMSGLFGRLTDSLSEEIRLKIVMKNISPYYQTQLGLMDISSTVQLRNYCRKLEASRASVEAFVRPPKKSSNHLEPDLAYVGLESSFQ